MMQRQPLPILTMNPEFLKRMEALLKEEFPAYLASLQEPVHRGLRVNTLKITVEELKKRLSFELRPTAISPTVFEIDSQLTSLGHSLEHRSGLYYLQEVSAASAVEVLDPQPGEWILDLCAAPGGKSTQIAMKMKHQGILFSNEIDPGRARILLSNLERCGVANAIVTQASPAMLRKQMTGWMDRILVDAPCSGEGMFKKESQALKDWSVAHVEACSQRQKKIVDDAVAMLKEGGILVYSTCTYALEENEEVIHDLLENHPEMELLDCNVSFGRPGYDRGKVYGRKVRRIFPMDEGEGHFVAKLRKNSMPEQTMRIEREPFFSSLQAERFLSEQLKKVPLLYHHHYQERLFLVPFEPLKLNRIRILRQGIELGELRKGRLEPHHHFYVTALFKGLYARTLECDREEAERFFRGETFPCNDVWGYTALEHRGICFGFAKADGTMAKNHYPKGLRMR